MVKINLSELKNLIDVASKRKEADLIIKNCKIINVFNESIEKGNIAISGKWIAGVGSYKEAIKSIDANDSFVCPGFIDSHMHIESTKLLPHQLSDALIPLGTTSVIVDPHEIANVSGIKGIKFLMNSSKNLNLDIFFMASSCVPATNFETNYKRLNHKNLLKLKKYENLLGLAEVMNYPAVINKDEKILNKIISFSDMIIDGHCPSLKGDLLNAYIGSGIYSDHECTTEEEANEKLAKGMYILIREGSVAKDLKNLVKIISEKTKNRILLCTDDIEPDDIMNLGHINNLISMLISEGVNLCLAIKLATLNPAIFFNLKRRGGIAPGYLSDLVIFEDLKSIKTVIKNGKIVYTRESTSLQNHKIYENNLNKSDTINNKKMSNFMLNSIKIKKIDLKSFKVKDCGKEIRVISLKKDTIITDQIIVNPRVINGWIESDIENDIIKIAVFERHHKTGNFTIGFINGLNLKRGAFATSIAHDSHNIVIVGENDLDMFTALNFIKKIKGGIVLASNGKIIDYLCLPYSGLISNMPLNDVAKKLVDLRKKARDLLGVKLEDPFMTISFMTLPVIPKIKITDKGLFDVDKFQFLKLFID